MNPALSVIFFTTSSGAGYGMLALLGVLAPFGVLPQERWFGAVAIAVALGLVTAGLLSSTSHLGRPERAWRAFSQWKTSWLAREGVAAVVTYLPALLFGWVWWVSGHPTGFLGLPAAIMALLTVYCTAMIYASLKPIRQWRNRLVPPVYLAFSLFCGAMSLAALAGFWNASSLRVTGGVALLLGVVAMVVKLLYWRSIDRAVPVSTAQTATGLGHLGAVRLLDAPNTETNYLLREMGFRVARKHATKLRRLAVLIGFALPALLVVVSLALPTVAAVVSVVLAALLVLCGTFVERWLFFAEATHTVGLYYGLPS